MADDTPLLGADKFYDADYEDSDDEDAKSGGSYGTTSNTARNGRSSVRSHYAAARSASDRRRKRKMRQIQSAVVDVFARGEDSQARLRRFEAIGHGNNATDRDEDLKLTDHHALYRYTSQGTLRLSKASLLLFPDKEIGNEFLAELPESSDEEVDMDKIQRRDELKHNRMSRVNSIASAMETVEITWDDCWYRIRAKALQSRLMRSLRNPYGNYRRKWNVLVFVVVLYSAITLPLRLAFHRLWQHPGDVAALRAFDYIGDVLLIFDIALNFYTPFSNESGFFVTKTGLIKQHYLHGWFALDFISSLPLGFFSFVVWQHSLLRLPRLLRLAKYNHYFNAWEQHAIGTEEVKIRFTKLLAALFLVLHWLGCLYIAVNYWKGFCPEADLGLGEVEEECWLAPEEVAHTSLSSQYVYGLFFAANEVLEVGGERRSPNSDLQRAFAITLALIALFVVAIIIGNVTDLIEKLNEDEEEMKEKLSALNSFMALQPIPPELQERIRKYFTNVLQRRGVGGIDDAGILDELPISLKTQTIKFMNRDILLKTALFGRCSTGFVNALVGHLKSQVNFAGDELVQEGDIGSEMFFIRQGKVEVILRGMVVNTLSRGDCFGEIAMLKQFARRTATIKACSYCELVVLCRDDLERVFEKFPHEKDIMTDVANTRTGTDRLRSKLVLMLLGTKTAGETLTLEERQMIDGLVHAFNVTPLEADYSIFQSHDPCTMLFFCGAGQVALWDEDLNEPPEHHARVSSYSRVVSSPRPVGHIESARSASPGVDHSMQNHIRVLATLGPGSFFGGMLPNETYRVCASTAGNSIEGRDIIFHITRSAFGAVVRAHPSFTHVLTDFMSKFRTGVQIAVARFKSKVERSSNKLPYLTAALAMFLRHHPATSRTKFAVHSNWVKRLGSISSKFVSEELHHMEAHDTLVAMELCHAINNLIIKEIFSRIQAH